jgi:hypothetical protein
MEAVNFSWEDRNKLLESASRSLESLNEFKELLLLDLEDDVVVITGLTTPSRSSFALSSTAMSGKNLRNRLR